MSEKEMEENILIQQGLQYLCLQESETKLKLYKIDEWIWLYLGNKSFSWPDLREQILAS